jgi:hypothetical protein
MRREREEMTPSLPSSGNFSGEMSCAGEEMTASFQEMRIFLKQWDVKSKKWTVEV